MFKLIPIQAAFGDCLLLCFGTEAEPRFILIDGGPPKNYEPNLRSALEHYVEDGHLDLLVLSHVDNDHVRGLIELFEVLKTQQANGEALTPPIQGLWHNSFSATIDRNGRGVEGQVRTMMNSTANAMGVMAHAGVALLGIGEGNKLRQGANILGIPVNQGIADPVLVGAHPSSATFGNLTLTVVGPTQANLDALEEEWIAWVKKHAKGIKAADPRVMANADRSVPNLSSICLVAEADGKSVLLTGDCRSDHLVEGLRSAGYLDENDEAEFDVIKLPHHGSDRNITRTFFRKIRAKQYVVSADGTHDNPDLATLTWIVEEAQKQGRDIEIIATNETDSTRKLLKAYPPSDHTYDLTIMESTEHWMEIALSS